MNITITMTDGSAPVRGRIAALLAAPERMHRAAVEGALPVVQKNFRRLASSSKRVRGWLVDTLSRSEGR